MPESETCRICMADETGDRTVRSSENIPLCNRHWSQWVARYAWPSEQEPPCSAHLIAASTLDDVIADASRREAKAFEERLLRTIHADGGL